MRKEIDQFLETLGIVNEMKDTLVGDIFLRGINLGERWRLELGLMVLAAPETVGLLFFLGKFSNSFLLSHIIYIHSCCRCFLRI